MYLGAALILKPVEFCKQTVFTLQDDKMYYSYMYMYMWISTASLLLLTLLKRLLYGLPVE